jgi:hypothetical protein
MNVLSFVVKNIQTYYALVCHESIHMPLLMPAGWLIFEAAHFIKIEQEVFVCLRDFD